MTNDICNQAVETAGDNGADFEAMRQAQIDRGIAVCDTVLDQKICGISIVGRICSGSLSEDAHDRECEAIRKREAKRREANAH